jgi:hypothetical protein
MKPQVFVLREEGDAHALYAYLKLNWRQQAAIGKPLSLSISPEKTKRSIQANAYYWGVTLKQISEQAWPGDRQFKPEIWHEEFKERFAPRIDRPFGGSYPMSTTDMDDEQFQTFNREVEAFAAQELQVRFVDDRAHQVGRPAA